jgi:hypothetical protein
MAAMSYAVLKGLGQDDGSSLDAWRREYGLAQEARIPVPILKAIKGVESGGNPAAIRFEPHVFWRLRKGLPDSATGTQIRNGLTPSELAAVPYTPCSPDWRSANGLSPCMRGSPPTEYRFAASMVPAETNRAAFNRAFALDPESAVRATSWGSGQVMGRVLVDAFGGDPHRAVQEFFANPVETGERMIVAWWRSARRDAIDAANASPPNFNLIARRYNGCGENCARYEGRLRSEYAESAPAWERVRSAVESAGAIVTEAAASAARSPAVPVVGAAVLLGGASFFLWSAWKRRKAR